MRTIPKFEPGTQPSAGALNTLAEGMRQLERRMVEVERRTTPDGSADDPPVRVRRFVVVNPDMPDTVVCSLYAGGPGIFQIAKPYLLRRSAFEVPNFRRDGIGYVYSSNSERTATRYEPPPQEGQSPPTENQRIIPKYVAGDVITATSQALDGTDDLYDGTGPDRHRIFTRWVDLNNDGRMWAKV